MADFSSEDTGYLIGVYINRQYLNPELIRRLEWTEDIEQSLMTGSITFVDIGDRIKELTGTDTIDIIHDISSSINPKIEPEKRLTFICYEISLQPMAQLQTKYNIITMKFIEKFYIPLCEVKYCWSWKDQPTSDIIQDIISDNPQLVALDDEAYRNEQRLGTPVFDIMDETNDEISYVMPNCTAIESIRWLMRRTISMEHGYGGYLFYSSNLGLNFTSLKGLIDMDSFEDGNQRYTFKPFGGDNSMDRFRILEHRVSYPKLQSMMKVSGKTLMGISCGTDISKSTQVYSKLTGIFSEMGDFGLFNDISSFGNLEYTGDNDTDILTNMAVHDFCREYVKQHIISIKVLGWPDQRKAGMKVRLDWQDNKSVDTNFKPLSGDYLVKTIRHEWGKENNSNYTQSMLLLTIAYNSETTTMSMKGN